MIVNVNEKGNLGIVKVLADLYQKDYTCFLPFDDYSPVDVIAMDKKGKLIRLQVKFRSQFRTGYTISTTSTVNGKKVPINRHLIDGWAVYLHGMNRIVYLPVEFMRGKASFTITSKNVDDFGSMTEWLM